LEVGVRKWEFGMWKWEGHMKSEVGMWKWEDLFRSEEAWRREEIV